MRILCTSDIHRSSVVTKNILGLLKKEKIDVFICAGDFLDNDFAYDFFQDLERLNIRSFIVPGNWDYGLEYESPLVTIGTNEIIEYNGYYFLPIEAGMPFDIEELLKRTKDIPNDKLIFITHYPPYGVLDKAWTNPHAGFMEYKRFLTKTEPALHVFGHIHESNGFTKYHNTLSINAALADYGGGRGYIVDLPEKNIKPVILNEEKKEQESETSNNPFRFQSTISRNIRPRK